jgi:hypothetical protein
LDVTCVYADVDRDGWHGALTWTLDAGSCCRLGSHCGEQRGDWHAHAKWPAVFSATAADTTSHIRSNSFSVSIYPVGEFPPPVNLGSNYGTFSISQVEIALSATGAMAHIWSVLSGTLPTRPLTENRQAVVLARPLPAPV